MNRFMALLVPLASALVALRTGLIPFKLGVPGSCGLILWWSSRSLPVGSRREVWMVIWAFGMSMLGDWFLSNREGNAHYFEAGIGAFFLAHLGYLGYAVMNGRIRFDALAFLLLVFLPYFGLALAPHMGSAVLGGAVLAYLLISCLALAAALGLRQPLGIRLFYVAGIGSIVLSDTVISFSEFLQFRVLNFLILPTYYLAHLLITYSILTRFGAVKRDRSQISFVFH